MALYNINYDGLFEQNRGYPKRLRMAFIGALFGGVIAVGASAQNGENPNNSDALKLRDDLYELSKIATGFFVNNHCNGLNDNAIAQLEADLNAINESLYERLGHKSHSLSAIQRTAYRHAEDLALVGCSDADNIAIMQTAKDSARAWAERIEKTQ